MISETEEVVLAIENRLANAVVVDSIKKIVDEDNLSNGHCEVQLKAYHEIAEYTPHDFSPTNDLEQYLFENRVQTEFNLTLPLSFELSDFIKGLSFNVRTFETKFDCEVLTFAREEDESIQVELGSHKLRRSLYIKVRSFPGS